MRRLLVLLIAMPAFAQVPRLVFSSHFDYTDNVFSGTASFRFPMPAISVMVNAPYYCQEKHEGGQTLPNGVHVSRPTLPGQKVWRDSQGRIRVEMTFASKGAGIRRLPTLVEIEDPVSGYTYIMDDIHKVAHRIKVSTMPQKNLEQLIVHGGPNAAAPASDFQDLGVETIDGVQVHGTRRTFVFPAGSRGNTAPITSTRDYWYSPDLNMIIRQVDNNPASGNSIEGVADLSRNEPDPALFFVPSGYKMFDETGTFEIKWGK